MSAQEEEKAETYTLFPLKSGKDKPLYVTVQVAGVPIQMKIDTWSNSIRDQQSYLSSNLEGIQA